MKNFMLNVDKLPMSQIPDGSWKAEIIIYNEDLVFLVIVIYFKTSTMTFG